MATKEDRLEAALRRHAVPVAEPTQCAAVTSPSLLHRGLARYWQLLVRSKALLQEVRSGPDQVSVPAPAARERAMKAAMAAWDAAVLSRTGQGLPAQAAVTAYRGVCPEPAEIVREKILSMIASRLEQRVGSSLH